MPAKGLISVVLMTLLTASGQASETPTLAFNTRFDSALWLNKGDKFGCTLEQEVEGFGTALFERKAGYQTTFRLLARNNYFEEGRASLIAEPPVWAPEKARRELGIVNVTQGANAINLESAQSHKMLAELMNGMAPTFKHIAWFNSAQLIDVALSSAHFKSAYGEFGQCAGGLLAKSYEQIERTRVHFVTNKYSLQLDSTASLDIIAEYVKADDSVSKIYVDGHTDDVFSRDYNIGLSKKRARTVTAYLMRAGIDKKKIVTRYHGERYPVVPNRDDASRAKNRRVTVRLER